MERKYVICTDVTSDLPMNFYQDNNVGVLYLSYILAGVEYSDGQTLEPHEFYEKMKSGEMPKTSQISPEQAEHALEGLVNEELDVLYISFSSGLSGSYNSVSMAAQTICAKYPDAKIRVVDSLCASLGEGLLVTKAVTQKNNGRSLDEVADYCEGIKLNLCHMFTVDDLMHLHRGGRVSATAAIAGSILGIKPVLHMDDEGHLIPIGKVRGRRQSLIALVDEMEKRMGCWDNETIAISHGDCEEEAIFVRDLVRKRFGIKNCIINYVGTVIGSHSGPKTVALFFLGDKR